MKRRRSSGEGTIYQLPSGSWRAQVSVGGKRLSHTAGSQAEARAWVRKIQGQIEQGLTYDASLTRFGDFLADWLEMKATELRVQTVQQYRWAVRKYLLPGLGKHKLKDITPERVQKFYNDLHAAGTGARTIQIVHVVMSSTMKHACRLGLAARNPAGFAIVPKVKRKPLQVWDEGQVSQFLVSIKGQRNEILYYLALATGMRRGELLGLRWPAVDWLNKTIRVEEQVFEPDGGGFVFQEPKTALGKRAVEVGKGVLVRLREQEERVRQLRLLAGERWREHDLVFPSTVGTPQNGYSVSKEVKVLAGAAGVPVIRFHDLRHTAASLMLSHNTPPVVVAGVLGHSLDILQKRYAHFIPSTQGQVAKLMDALTSPIVAHELHTKDKDNC